MRYEVLIIGCGEIGLSLIDGWLNKRKEFYKKISLLFNQPSINAVPISPQPIISTSSFNYALPSVLKSKNKIASSAFLPPQSTNWRVGKNLSLSNIA